MTPSTSVVVPLVTNLIWATVKATALLAATALLVRLLRRRAAALRHLIWTIALGAAVALLVLPGVLPAWRVVPMPSSSPAIRALVPDVIASPATAAPARQAVSGAAVTRTVGASARGQGAPAAPPALPEHFNHLAWAALAFALWVAGVMAIVVRYAWSRISLARLARRSTPADDDVIDAQIMRAMRTARPVRIRTSGDVDLPMTWGIVHPQIVLPADAREWTAACRRHVLQHELAHIRRLDAATQLVAQAASALFWFNPLVWFAVAEMRRERERACDDCVLAGGAVASDYASDLLSLVTNHGYADRHTMALAFARRSQFEGRLLALLDPSVERGVLSRRGVVLFVGASLGLVAPLAAMQKAAARPVRPAEQPQSTSEAPAQRVAQTSAARIPTMPTMPAVAPTVHHPAPPLVSAASQRHEETHIDAPAPSSPPLPDLFASCTSTSQGGSSHHDSDESSEHNGGMVWTSSGEFGGCSFELESEGQIGFSADGTSIEHLSEGGYLKATTNIHGEVTSLTVRGAPDGTLAYQLATSSGQSVAAGEWLAQFLLGLDRTTAFAVDRRFPVLMQSGGAPLVLSDIEQMHTSYARYVYAERLLQSANLDPASLRRMAAVVSSMNSDHTAGQLITGVAERYPLTDPVVHTALLAAALTMNGDHEWARSTVPIVTKSELSPNETLAVLESANRMRVDFEKTSVLLALAASQRLDGNARTAFLSAAGTIRQSYQRDRVMAALR